MLQYKFDKDKSSFYKVLKQKVDDYFVTNKLYPTGGRRLYIKGSLQVLSAILIYIVLVFFTPSTPFAILLSLLFGINLAIIGFNVMHEGGHQTFSRFKWLNVVAAYFLNVLGGNIHFWKRKHNIDHHTYTNVDGMDSDINVKPFLRLHEDQPLKFYHRFQHIYSIILYGFTYLSWIFYEDFQKYMTSKATPILPKKRLAMKEHVIFWSTKLFYLGVYAVIPILMLGWLPWLIGFLIVTTSCGLVISVVFQLAHVVENTEFHTTNNENQKMEWALHQLASTSNFSTASKTLYWLLGGLNFQIEHHLFPHISHIHYSKISLLVKEVCKEYNIAYHEYSNLFRAIASHLIHLRNMGRAT